VFYAASVCPWWFLPSHGRADFCFWEPSERSVSWLAWSSLRLVAERHGETRRERNRPTSLTFGNGRTLAKSYDQNYWIDTVNGSPAGLSLDFGTDDVGNIVGITVGSAANDRVYDYDDLHRLTSVVNGTAANVEAFAYDPTGNRLSKRIGAASAVPYAYPTTSHRLQSVGGVTRGYDPAGNTTAMPSAANAALTLVYDACNRLSRIDGSGGTLQANHYNGRGERVRKVAGSNTALFIYDEAGRLLGEHDASGVPRQLFVWMDDQPVAVIDGGTLRYIETDHLNTPRTLIDPARNVAVWRWDLNGSAFGEHAANEDPDADGTPVKFNLRCPGQYLDAETGLHYNYFRDYEPGTGRYVESDPVGQTFSYATYAYADGAPLLAIDPDGLGRYVPRPPNPRPRWIRKPKNRPEIRPSDWEDGMPPQPPSRPTSCTFINFVAPICPPRLTCVTWECRPPPQPSLECPPNEDWPVSWSSGPSVAGPNWNPETDPNCRCKTMRWEDR